MDSIWVGNSTHATFESLKGDLKTDVLIVGGGMAGLLCAFQLKNAGVDCALVEAKQLCSGITKNTTAKITLQHSLIYNKLIKRFGYEYAQLFLNAQKDACEEYAKLCQGIDCDYEKKDAYVYSISDRNKIENEISALNSLGYKADFCESIELPIDIAGAAKIGEQAQFHPLKFVSSIANNLPIYENTKVLQLLPNRAVTQHGEITCKKMIIATHFPMLNKHGSYFLKLYQHRSYVIALSGTQKINEMYVDENEKGMSFRSYDDLLLLGGGAHRTGKKGGTWLELKEFADRNYPPAKMISQWATQDCMTLDGVPYIGQYSAKLPDVYVATGFNKWGMSSSMVAAMLLKDLILRKQNDYASVFSPSRSMLRAQLAINAFESVLGILTPTTPRCPHLGCALKYNRQEHSWDCPCHGSRFSENGELIDNPATDDKKGI